MRPRQRQIRTRPCVEVFASSLGVLAASSRVAGEAAYALLVVRPLILRKPKVLQLAGSVLSFALNDLLSFLED